MLLLRNSSIKKGEVCVPGAENSSGDDDEEEEEESQPNSYVHKMFIIGPAIFEGSYQHQQSEHDKP
jgi:hypothetical protein